MSKELEALQILRELVEYLTRIDDDPASLRNEVRELIVNGYEDIDGYFWQIEVALNELECAQHNYGALKEFYNNSAAYGAKIQAELNELKKLNEPMKVNSFDPSSYYGLLGYFECPKCGEILTKGYYNYCPDCGQKFDRSDEK